jgi:putative two-component system response regulator
MVSAADDPALAESALDFGAYGYVVKPFRRADITIAVANALRRRRLELENRSHRDRLEQLVSQRTAALQHSREETIHRLARAAESRDSDTGKHIERVSRISFLLAQQLGLSDDEAELVRIASPLHDLGKIAIRDTILFKSGPLTPEERAAMERHAEQGHAMLAGSGEPLMDLAADIAWTHHERFDGSGYPRGLLGDEIPIAGRIVAVADVFDALLSERVYRSALSERQTLRLMRLGRGTHFDPDVLDLLLDNLEAALEIRVRLEDEPRLQATG